MRLDDFHSRSPVTPPGASQWVRLAHRCLAWLVVLCVAALTVGVAIAAADPDWDGTEPLNVSHSPQNRAWHPVIATGLSGRVVVAWSDQQPGGGPEDRDIVTSSYDNGHTWSPATVITKTADTSQLPDLLIVGERTFVAWYDQADTSPYTATIFEAESETGVTRRIPTPLFSISTRPSLAAGTDRLHIVFGGGGTDNIPDIYYAMRPLTATAWPTATVVYTHTAPFGSWNPMLAVGPDGKTLHVVWEERTLSSERTIMYMRGEVNGAAVNWETAYAVSPGGTGLVNPTIAADAGGNLHVVWGEVVRVGGGGLEQQDQYIRYRRYDAASGWGSATRIDNNPVKVNKDNPTYTSPDLALFEGGDQVEICVAWHGFRAGESESAEEVLLSCSQNEGQSWSPPQNVSRSGAGISIALSIAFDGAGQLHGVWQEHTQDMGSSVVYDYQVYYSRALNQVFLPLIGK